MKEEEEDGANQRREKFVIAILNIAVHAHIRSIENIHFPCLEMTSQPYNVVSNMSLTLVIYQRHISLTNISKPYPSNLIQNKQ